MCFDGDMADVWKTRAVRARKPHRCNECRLPIPVGDVYIHIDSLFEGEWDHYRVHNGCYELSKFIDKTLCGSSGFPIGYLSEEISSQDSEDAHPHLRDNDDFDICPPDCMGMSTRGTLEWLWDMIRLPYLEIQQPTN